MPTATPPVIPPDFEAMARACPDLAEMRLIARTIARSRRTDSFCANMAWEGFKKDLTRLVGWRAADDRMATTDHFDAAFHAIYSELPPCGPRCGCL